MELRGKTKHTALDSEDTRRRSSWAGTFQKNKFAGELSKLLFGAVCLRSYTLNVDIICREAPFLVVTHPHTTCRGMLSPVK